MAALTVDFCNKIAALLKKADCGCIVSGCKQLLQLLLAGGGAYQMKLQCKFVGCHPCNRDGYGVNGIDCHSLMGNIFEVGFDPDEVRAVCAEMGPSDQEAMLWNEQMVADGNEMLAPVEYIKCLSVWGSHTNQGFRAIDVGLKSDQEAMCVGGFFSLEKIKQKDPAFADAVTNGVTWTVITHQVIAKFPDLLPLIQAAGNAAGQLAAQEHEFQVLRKLHNAWRAEAATLGPAGHVSFGAVKAKVMRSKPPCAAALPGMYGFVLRCSGGSEPVFLRETEAYVRAFAGSARRVSPDTWDALAADMKGNETVISLFKTVCGCVLHFKTLRV
jgi:hypothetical protein